MDAEHHDPWSDATRQGLERIMALAVLAEAGSRLHVESKRAAAARRERQAAKIADEARKAMAAHQQKVELSARQAREWARFAGDPQRLRDYLAGLKFQELARQWAAASFSSRSKRWIPGRFTRGTISASNHGSRMPPLLPGGV